MTVNVKSYNKIQNVYKTGLFQDNSKNFVHLRSARRIFSFVSIPGCQCNSATVSQILMKLHKKSIELVLG